MLKKNYSLLLTDGTAWTLQASNNLREWITHFAKILQLNETTSKKFRSIFFTENRIPKIDSDKETAIIDPKKGWISSSSNIYSNNIDDGNDIFCKVDFRTNDH
ncbi:hypothetical protein JXO59_10495, partial [candidate division KSB1 bacterium]|nr:hypothetical protein [candidate division KSB1 bacterium]